MEAPFPTYFKHLIECTCILPQFQNKTPILYHKFIVFSVLDEDGVIISKLVRCNNCNKLHKITDYQKSDLLGENEYVTAIRTINDVKRNIPYDLNEILNKKNIDAATYEQIEFYYENKIIEKPIVLEEFYHEFEVHGTYLVFKDDMKYSIKNFVRSELIT